MDWTLLLAGIFAGWIGGSLFERAVGRTVLTAVRMELAKLADTIVKD